MSLNADTALLARRRRAMGPAYRTFYPEPLHLVKAQGTRMWDKDGRAYLDAYNNVPSVGHCHPRVLAAMTAEAATLNTHTRYLHERVVDYAERLTALFPPELSQVMMTCTGSEANDLALRVARAVTGQSGVIVTRHAYHGVTTTLAGLSPALGPSNAIANNVRLVDAPDTYRLGGEGARAAFTRSVRAAVTDLQANGQGVAALLVDTVFASDGIFVDPVGILEEAVEVVRAAGGLYIADEVQSGLARPGAHMWAFERHRALPDLVTLGKPVGAGHPMAALIARPAHLEAFAEHGRYFNTFGGNPVSAAIGLAVLDVIRDEGLLENAARVGAQMLQGLREVVAGHPLVGDIRGAGLYAALELIAPDGEKQPSAAHAARLMQLMREEGVLVGLCGAHNQCLKIRPPLPFSAADCDDFLASLTRALARLLV